MGDRVRRRLFQRRRWKRGRRQSESAGRRQAVSGGVGATINLSANGVDNTQPSVKLGERLRVTNNDTRAHQFMTTPHNVHTDCPALNAIGSLAPGQSGTSDPLTTARGCGFHDHMNPDDPKFRGQVLVGLGSNDPPPPDPTYLR